MLLIQLLLSQQRVEHSDKYPKMKINGLLHSQFLILKKKFRKFYEILFFNEFSIHVLKI